MRSVTLIGADSAAGQAADEYVLNHGDAPPFALSGYSDVLSAVYKVETPRWMVKSSSGEVCGVLAAYVQPASSGGGTIKTPPYGLLGDDAGAVSALLDSLASYCIERRLMPLTVCSGVGSLDGGDLFEKRITIVKEVASSADAVWDDFRSKTRNVIRKAQKAGVRVLRGREHLPAFYGVYRRRMAELGIAIHSYTYFAGLFSSLPSHARLYVAELDGLIVGGMVFLFGTATGYYLINASSAAGQAVGSNDALMWEALKDASAEGIMRLDLAGAREGSGVYRFKTKEIGGEPETNVCWKLAVRQYRSGSKGSLPLPPLSYRISLRLAQRLPAAFRPALLTWNKRFENLS